MPVTKKQQTKDRHQEILEAASRVVFLGRSGTGDDRRARPSAVTASTVDVVVPLGARSGPVRAVGQPARSPRPKPA